MNFILNLEEIDRSVHKAGDKAHILNQLIKSDFPVPPAFIITKNAFLLHLKSNQLEEKIKSYTADLQNKVSKDKISQLIVEAEIPFTIRNSIKEAYDDLSFGKEANVTKQALEIIRSGRSRIYVAVRPSANTLKNNTHGYINIIGLDKLLETIKSLWASIYLESLETKQNIEFSIIVQKMLDPEKSGFLFTKNPVYQDQTLIEATWSHSQSISFGLVDPDIYSMNNVGDIISKKISKKLILLKKDQTGKMIAESPDAEKINTQVITDQEALKLLEYSRKIEELFGEPQEIEWCIDRGRLFLLKSKPIKVKDVITQDHVYGQEIGSGISASPGFAKGKVRIVSCEGDLGSIDQGDIIACNTPNPQLISYINKASALLTESGGLASFAAEASRGIGIPCIVGIESLTKTLTQNQEIMVDGISGKIYLEKQVHEQPRVRIEEPNNNSVLATEIRVKLTSLENLNAGANLDGFVLSLDSVISAVNTETLETTVSDYIKRVALISNPKTILYKTIDKVFDPGYTPNPLGIRGARKILTQPEIFNCELAAIKSLNKDGINNICILIPFITTVEELRKIKKLIDFQVKIGICVEVPSVAIDIENFCRDGIDIASIDLSSLAQLTLSLDKSNDKLSELYSELHPSILFLIKNVVTICKKYSVKVNIISDSLQNPDFIDKFIEMGIDSITTDFNSVKFVRQTVFRKEKQILLDKVREINHTQEVPDKSQTI